MPAISFTGGNRQTTHRSLVSSKPGNRSTARSRPSSSNTEGLLGAGYDAYRFRFGIGRVRVTTNDALKIKLTNNFYFIVGFWDNYDSRLLLDATKNELQLQTRDLAPQDGFRQAVAV